MKKVKVKVTGYPGWHIECSAMSMKYLGQTLDIHTGGEDNIFPHHECEIAQSEGATGKPFVKYWMHTRHLMVEGKKMSKSLGNFYTLRDLIKKGHGTRAIRYLLLSVHYRTKLNLTEAALKQAEKTVKSLDDFLARLRGLKKGKENPKVGEMVRELEKGFREALDDDLNISLGLARLFGVVGKVNKLIAGKRLGPRNAKAVVKVLLDLDKVLGLELGKIEKMWHSLEEAEERVRDLIFQRELYRKEKRWGKADRIRNELRKEGIILEDTKEGVKWKRERG